MLTSRERVMRTLNHQQPDRVPLDLGSTNVTGIAASSLYRLRHGLGLPERPIRVHEPYQMLGLVEDDVLDALGVDIIGLGNDNTFFGFPQRDWKPFTLFDGTPVVVPGGFNTEIAADGALYQYPEGDKSVPPSGRMPADGFYHDAIERQEPYSEETLDPEEWVRDMYQVFTDEKSALTSNGADYLNNGTTAAISSVISDRGVLGILLLSPARPSNTQRASAPWLTGTWLPHFTQIMSKVYLACNWRLCSRTWSCIGRPLEIGSWPFSSVARTLDPKEAPLSHRRATATCSSLTIKRSMIGSTRTRPGRTFYHSCGSMVALYDDFVDAGVDVVNPVQISAAAWTLVRSSNVGAGNWSFGVAVWIRSTRDPSAHRRRSRPT